MTAARVAAEGVASRKHRARTTTLDATMLAYEELKGSNGKEIWFRPTRFDARKLFPNNPPRVRVKSSSYQLHNISLTGIAVVAKQAMEDELTVGETVPIVFQQAGLSIFEGRA
jgi:hypothetical protein